MIRDERATKATAVSAALAWVPAMLLFARCALRGTRRGARPTSFFQCCPLPPGLVRALEQWRGEGEGVLVRLLPGEPHPPATVWACVALHEHHGLG